MKTLAVAAAQGEWGWVMGGFMRYSGGLRKRDS